MQTTGVKGAWMGSKSKSERRCARFWAKRKEAARDRMGVRLDLLATSFCGLDVPAEDCWAQSCVGINEERGT